MKRMIRYGMKPVRYRIVVINVLLALALTPVSYTHLTLPTNSRV